MEIQTNLLFSYLCEKFPENKEYYELIRYEMDSRIYYYGDHYKHHLERKPAIFEQLKDSLVEISLSLLIFIRSKKKQITRPAILSTAYFNIQNHFDQNRLIISRPPWQYNEYKYNFYNYELYKEANKIKRQLLTKDAAELMTNTFFEKVRNFENKLEKWILEKDFKAVFVPSNVGFFDKLAIRIFRKINRPSFTFIHGLPGAYSKIDNNLADYLAVWGESIRNNYIREGINAKKIIVTGHPKYITELRDSLTFNLNNVLVISKSLPGAQVGGRYTLRDRSNLIYYLLLIRDVLKSLGVSKARLRPHPSENPSWYTRFLGTDFFVLDNQPLHLSLSVSGVVIGPTSTVFVEALQAGVNYVIFEPRLNDGRGLDGGSVVRPFDGTDQNVPSADTPERLSEILRERRSVDSGILKDYFSQKFDVAEVIRIIENHKR